MAHDPRVESHDRVQVSPPEQVLPGQPRNLVLMVSLLVEGASSLHRVVVAPLGTAAAEEQVVRRFQAGRSAS